ncbi:MAG: hypothetical protein IKU10_00695, partial [Clostridia bacterium]|nr:hypothetical protein [Clostridia bacterium]
PTAKAACKRHKDKQSAANTRWHKQEPKAQPKLEENPLPQEQECPESEPEQPEETKAPQGRMYHIGKYHNVFLTQPEYDDLKEQFQKEFPMIIDQFSRYKMANKFTLLYDYHALLHYLEHGEIPEGLFDRMEGVIPPHLPRDS